MVIVQHLKLPFYFNFMINIQRYQIVHIKITLSYGKNPVLYHILPDSYYF